MPLALILLDFVPNQKRTFETFLTGVVRSLRVRGWSTVLAVAGEPAPDFVTELLRHGASFQVVPFPLRGPSIDRLVESLNGRRPDVLTSAFVSCFDRGLLKLKKRLRVKRWIVHDNSSGHASRKSGVNRLLAKARGWYVGQHVDRVLAISEFVARRNVEQSHLPPSCVRVLSNGVDLARFRPMPRDTNHTEQSLAFVGQLIPAKGVGTLLRAMLILRSRYQRTPLLEIAGRGGDEERCRDFVRQNELHNVRFLGQVADVAETYRRAALVVVPSEWAEGFGLVVAEAMACGSCVLAADIGGIPEVVGGDGEAGLLFRSGDADDLAAKINSFLAENPHRLQSLRVNARRRVEQFFSLDVMIEGFVAEIASN